MVHAVESNFFDYTNQCVFMGITTDYRRSTE